MQLEDRGSSIDAYLGRLAERGGIVEERIVGDEVRSPSVQLRVTPLGELEILSTHDQILGGPTGQMYLGARFPADPAYATADHARGGGGRAGSSPTRGCSAGSPSTSSSSGTVTRGRRTPSRSTCAGAARRTRSSPCSSSPTARYVHEEGRFRTPSGAERHLVATDHLEDDALRGLRVDDLFDLVARAGLHFDQSRQAGVVFHMISSITECGRVGMTAIGDTPDSAQDVFDRAESALLAEARASLVPLPVPLRGRLGEGLR